MAKHQFLRATAKRASSLRPSLKATFRKGCECGKRLIGLALSEARSVRKPPQACNGAGDFFQMLQAAVFDRVADHGTLLLAAMLHSIYQRERRFSLGQIVAQMLTQARLVGLVVERIVDQLECGTDVPTDNSPVTARFQGWHRSRRQRFARRPRIAERFCGG